jgi:hypothetical protein
MRKFANARKASEQRPDGKWTRRSSSRPPP